VNGKLPTQLDGVSVSLDGKPAYVYFVSPGQIDVIAPADSAAGSVSVVVTNNNVATGAGTVQLNAEAPAFFAAGNYVVATHANGSLVGPANVLPGATPARPGETIAVYGTGFGATNPAVDGQVIAAPVNVAAPPVITIKGLPPVTVTFAGLVSAGLDQINLTIPALPAGTMGTVDVPIMAAIGGFSTQTGLLVTVQSGN
jgi:uncharacterized protein (TIGR03437 family)